MLCEREDWLRVTSEQQTSTHTRTHSSRCVSPSASQTLSVCQSSTTNERERQQNRIPKKQQSRFYSIFFFFLRSFFSFDNSRTYRKQLYTLNQTAVANRLCVPQCVVSSARAINIIYIFFLFLFGRKNEISEGKKISSNSVDRFTHYYYFYYYYRFSAVDAIGIFHSTGEFVEAAKRRENHPFRE